LKLHEKHPWGTLFRSYMVGFIPIVFQNFVEEKNKERERNLLDKISIFEFSPVLKKWNFQILQTETNLSRQDL